MKAYWELPSLRTVETKCYCRRTCSNNSPFACDGVVACFNCDREDDLGYQGEGWVYTFTEGEHTAWCPDCAKRCGCWVCGDLLPDSEVDPYNGRVCIHCLDDEEKLALSGSVSFSEFF